MKELKIGDKVRVVKCSQSNPKHEGRVGTIYVNYGDGDYTIQFSNDSCIATRVKPIPKKPKVKKKKTSKSNKLEYIVLVYKI